MSSTTTITKTQPARRITAENVLSIFPDVDPGLASSHRAPGSVSTVDPSLAGHDAEQIRLMEEVCIVLDVDDKPIGSASKKTCHLMTNIEAGLLHRAFSIFLFNPTTRKLLLQRRAAEKITFPGMWTNTCCSHPLGVPGETGADLGESIAGTKRAAQRKLGHELGIKKEQVPVEDMRFLGRIHYLANSGMDGIWGEHEIDYILFIQADVDLAVNENEVQDIRYVSPQDLKEMFKEEALTFTPWFKLICNSLLFEWWEHLDKGLENWEGDTEIRRM